MTNSSREFAEMKARYQDIDERLDTLQIWMDTNKALALDFQSKFEMSLIYHENALDGLVVTGPELMGALGSLADATDSALVPIYREVRNHKAAIDFMIGETKKPESRISMGFIHQLHALLTQTPPAERDKARDASPYRKEVPVHRSYFHEIARPEEIAGRLEDLVDELDTSDYRELHPIEQACFVHWHFMQVFPFPEKSGKVARLLANYVLLKHGYTSVIIHAADRQRYYEALRLSLQSMQSLTVDALINSLDNALQYFQGSRPVPLSRHGHHA